jgi:hypothetical protein
MMNKLAVGLGVLGLVAGCAPIDEAPLGTASDALTLRAQPVELPTTDELPDCWWADSARTCLQLCEEDDTAELQLRAPVRGATGALASPTRVLASSSPPRVGGPDDLAAPEDDDCHTPDGVLPCPHCTTNQEGQTRIGDFWVNNGLGTHVVIANSLGKFRVARFAALDASLLSVEGEPEIPNTHHVTLDLLAGGEELAATASEPTAAQDLYLLFAYSGQVGQIPAVVWMRCPAAGSECQPYFP